MFTSVFQIKLLTLQCLTGVGWASFDSNLIFVGTSSGYLKCIDQRMSGKFLIDDSIHRKRIRRLLSSPLKPGIFLSCSDDCTIAAHTVSISKNVESDSNTGMSVVENLRLRHHSDYVSDICWSESIEGEEDEIFSSSYDGSFRRSSINIRTWN